MLICAIEDRQLLLDALVQAISDAAPFARVASFAHAEDALAAPDAYAWDVAFVDIELPGMSGLTFAQQLMEHNPRANVVFVTGYDQYMADAWRMHSSGFISKPITATKVRHELEHLRFPLEQRRPRLYIRCFGNFEVFVDGEPLNFSSMAGRELLAYLVDRRGARCKVRELEAVLWEGHPHSTSKQSQLRHIIIALNQDLTNAGCPDVLIRSYGAIALDVSSVSCDYYDYLDGQSNSRARFRGEYMTQYSWAERTLANLIMYD